MEKVTTIRQTQGEVVQAIIYNDPPVDWREPPDPDGPYGTHIRIEVLRPAGFQPLGSGVTLTNKELTVLVDATDRFNEEELSKWTVERKLRGG